MTSRRKVLVIVGICAAIGGILGVAEQTLGLNQGVGGGIAGGICAVVAMRLWRRA